MGYRAFGWRPVPTLLLPARLVRRGKLRLAPELTAFPDLFRDALWRRSASALQCQIRLPGAYDERGGVGDPVCSRLPPGFPSLRNALVHEHRFACSLRLRNLT